MVIIPRKGKPDLYFAEVKDFPYFHTLSAEAQEELKNHLAEKLENYYKQRKYIAMLMSRRDADVRRMAKKKAA